jgi:hypothetical protein
LDVEEDRKEKAKKIYDNYIESEILNLSYPSSNYVKENFLRAPPDLFTKAKEEIKNLLVSDSFPRFSLSIAFSKLLVDYYNVYNIENK